MKNETQNGMNRRQFVKTSALVAGGLAVSSMAMGYHPDGDDAIRVGLVGCGGRGTGAALQALTAHPRVKLVAMGDAFQDRLEGSLKTLQDPSNTDWSGSNSKAVLDRIDVPKSRQFVGFDAYKEVLKLCDVVILATPPGFRPTHFAAAVEAGKHVFMEKPVATDAPGIRQVLAAAEQAKAKKLNVVVGLQRHYQTVYREWMKRIHDGAIGEIVASRVYWNSDGVWVNERKPGMTEMEYQMRNWYYFNWLCGDHITEQHIHNIDVGNWAKRAHPIKASGMGGRQVRTGKEFGEIFDHHTVEYEYADGSRMYSQCRHIKGCQNKVTEAFHGTKGSAPEPGVLLDASGNVLYKHRDKNDPNPYQVEHDELFAAVAAGEYKFADAENGAHATLSAIMGRLATYSGQEITWEDALKSDISLQPKRIAWDAEMPLNPGPDGFYPVAIPGVTKVI